MLRLINTFTLGEGFLLLFNSFPPPSPTFLVKSTIFSPSPPFPSGSVLAHYNSELQRLRSEYAGLSGCKRESLEQLLMEGDLLEVTMDEVQQLWQLLQLDTEYLSAFDTSPAKVGGRFSNNNIKQEVHVYR